jgi:surface antigen
LRSGLKLALSAAAVGLVLPMAVASSSVPTAAQSPAPASDPTAAQRDALLGQLSGQPQVAAAERSLAEVQAHLRDTRAQLTVINARLAAVSQRIADDQYTLDHSRVQLAGMLRQSFVLAGQDGFAESILTSGDFNQAFDRVQSSRQASHQLQDMLTLVRDRQAALRQERAQLEQDKAAATDLETKLEADANRFLALSVQRDQVLAAAPAPVRHQAAAVVAAVDALYSPAESVPHSGPCGNHFSYGQCTWYVATRRCIPWFGNAYQWWGAARAAGYLEGHEPAVGAVVVFPPGGQGAGGVGHVGYVEAVGPAPGVPAGSFKLSEMNYAGWNRVSYRVLPNHAPGITGFIYGHA